MPNENEKTKTVQEELPRETKQDIHEWLREQNRQPADIHEFIKTQNQSNPKGETTKNESTKIN